MAAGILFWALVLVFMAIFIALIVIGSLIETGNRVEFAGRVGAVIRKILPQTLVKRYDALLVLAGSPRDMSVDILLGIKVLIIPFSIFSLMVLGQVLAAPLLASPLILLLSGIAFSFGPDLWLSHTTTVRRQEIRRSLPDTLDLLTINVEAGLSFDAAVSRVVDNLKGPLVEELTRTLREIQLGRSRIQSLRALMERTNVSELNSFVLALIEAQSFGISIGQTLRSQSRDMRIRRRQNAEQTAMKTPVKIIFPLVLLIFPAILIIIIGPAAIRIVSVLGSSGR